MPKHKWEDPGTDEEEEEHIERESKRHRWEDTSDDSDSDFDIGDLTPGEEYVKYNLELYWARTLNATQFCNAMFLASQAGIMEAKPYAVELGKRHCQEKLDKILGSTKEAKEIYEVFIAGTSKHDLSRTIHMVPCFCAHELWAEHVKSVMVRDAIETYVRESPMTPAYENHPLVKDAAGTGEIIAPIAVYIDGVSYSITDSVIGFWIVCQATKKRFLAGILRKKNMCACGCRGWCSIYMMLEHFTWSLKSISSGIFPETRHDAAPWRASDADRALMGGEKMQMRGAIVYIKGDWSEYASTMGFPAWNDGLRPCFECAAAKEDFYRSHGHGTDTLAWPSNHMNDYDEACKRCEINVCLDAAGKREVLRSLRYDKRDHGSRGRALTRNIPRFGLLADDRLEPSERLRDVGNLENLETPVRVTFWRCSQETLARHRNRLFCDELGTSPSTTLTIDELHAMNLGVMQTWAKGAIWIILDSGMYGTMGTSEENLAIAVLGMRHDLMNFYARNREKKLTEVHNFTVKMVGRRNDQHCKTKGAETWGLLQFLVEKLGEHGGVRFGDDGKRYLKAGQNLKKMVEIWREHDDVVPAEKIKDYKGINKKGANGNPKGMHGVGSAAHII